MGRRTVVASYWLLSILAIVIILFGLWVRIVENLRMPVQWLEGWSVYLAQEALNGNVFTEPAESMRWLSGPLHALFYPVGPEGIWLLRTFSGLLAVLNIAICIRLGTDTHSRLAGLTAGALYAIIPLTVFHERQALIDPILATFTSLALFFSWTLARRPNWVWAVLAGVTLGAAFLTKVSALPFWIMPAWAVILLARRNHCLQGLALSGVALSIALALVVAAFSQFVRLKPDVYPSVSFILTDPFIGLSPNRGEGATEYFEGVQKSLRQAGENITIYVGMGVVFLVALCLVWVIRGHLRREIAYLTVPALLFPWAPILSDASKVAYRDPYYTARYMLSSALPLVVLAAVSLALLRSMLTDWRRGRVRWLVSVVAIGLAAPAMAFDVVFITDPVDSPLPSVDRWQYITGRPSGIGYDGAARDVLRLWADNEGQPVHVVATGNAMQLRGYLGPRVGQVLEYRANDDEQIATLARWLANEETVLFFDGNLKWLLPSTPHDAQLELIQSYPTRWGGTLNLYRVTGAEGMLADYIAERESSSQPDQ